MHLRLSLDNPYKDHPEYIMRRFGITYQKATPQSIGDQWWFWNCQNIPCPLPEGFSFLDVDPEKCIGFGLSQKDADEIKKFGGWDG